MVVGETSELTPLPADLLGAIGESAEQKMSAADGRVKPSERGSWCGCVACCGSAYRARAFQQVLCGFVSAMCLKTSKCLSSLSLRVAEVTDAVHAALRFSQPLVVLKEILAASRV